MAIPPENGNGASLPHHDSAAVRWDELLANHVILLESHQRLLHDFKIHLTPSRIALDGSNASQQPLPQDTPSTHKTLLGMLARAKAAVMDAKNCHHIVRQEIATPTSKTRSPMAKSGTPQSNSPGNNSSHPAAEELVSLRSKRRFEDLSLGSGAETTTDGDSSTRIQHPSKRQRIAHQPPSEPIPTVTTTATLATAPTATVPTAAVPVTTDATTPATPGLIPQAASRLAPEVEYDDLTAEVEARLERLEQQRMEERKRLRADNGDMRRRGKRMWVWDNGPDVDAGASAGDDSHRRRAVEEALGGEAGKTDNGERLGKRMRMCSEAV